MESRNARGDSLLTDTWVCNQIQPNGTTGTTCTPQVSQKCLRETQPDKFACFQQLLAIFIYRLDLRASSRALRAIPWIVPSRENWCIMPPDLTLFSRNCGATELMVLVGQSNASLSSRHTHRWVAYESEFQLPDNLTLGCISANY